MDFKDSIDRILSNIQISSLIGKYVDLKKKGANHFGLCPFHKEKSPSFSVNDDKKIFHCFGCGESGNAISFLMKYKELPFKKALVEAAAFAGIQLENLNFKKWKDQEDLRQKITNINKKAASLYHQKLLSNPDNPAFIYLKEQRKLSSEMIEKFFLGYSPDSWDFLSNKYKEKLPTPLLLETGLFGKKKQGNSIYDYFREKVIFPIFDVKGYIIGYGSRVLDDSKPKYINSPETRFFKKKETLYALNFAVEEIRKQKKAIIVEGYMDVIALHQNGFLNAVAPLGTAFSTEHIQILSRYAEEAILIFDGDEAGQKATLRALEIALNANFQVKVLSLPQGKDPYDFILENGKESFEHSLNNESLSWEDFLINPLLREENSQLRRNKIIATLKLFTDKDPFLTQSFLEKLSIKLKIDLKEIKNFFNRMKNERANYFKNTKEIRSPQRKQKSNPEIDLVLILINTPSMFLDYQDKISPATFNDETASILFEAFSKSFDNENRIFREDLFYSLIPQETLNSLKGKIFSSKYKTEPQKQIEDLFIYLRLSHLLSQKQSLLREIKEAELKNEQEKITFLMQELLKLSREEEELKKKRRFQSF